MRKPTTNPLPVLPKPLAKSGEVREVPVDPDVMRRTAVQEFIDPPKFPKLK